MSGLVSSECFVEISKTPEGLQKHIEKALNYIITWRVTANVNTYAVVTCNEDNESRQTIKWKWGKLKMPIVDQYAYLGVQNSKYCSWDALIAEIVVTGKAHVGKTNAILTDSHLL